MQNLYYDLPSFQSSPLTFLDVNCKLIQLRYLLLAAVIGWALLLCLTHQMSGMCNVGDSISRNLPGWSSAAAQQLRCISQQQLRLEHEQYNRSDAMPHNKVCKNQQHMHIS